MKFIKQLPALLVLAFSVPASGYYYNLKTLCYKGHTVLLVSDCHAETTDSATQISVLRNALPIGKNSSNVNLIIEDAWAYHGKDPSMQMVAANFANKKNESNTLVGWVNRFNKMGLAATSIEHRWFFNSENCNTKIRSFCIEQLAQTMQEIADSAGQRHPVGSVIGKQQAMTIRSFVEKLIEYTKKDNAKMYDLFQNNPETYHNNYHNTINLEPLIRAAITHPRSVRQAIDNDQEFTERQDAAAQMIREGIDKARNTITKSNQSCHASSVDALALNKIIAHARRGNLTIVMAGGAHCAALELMLKKLVGYETVANDGEQIAGCDYLYNFDPVLFPENRHALFTYQLKRAIKLETPPESLLASTIYKHVTMAVKRAQKEQYDASAHLFNAPISLQLLLRQPMLNHEDIPKASSYTLDPKESPLVTKVFKKLPELRNKAVCNLY